jgi:hypothetical protein
MLRLNFQAGNKKPVRVIRGPKLASKWGTANSGGGYRYDGLYEVVSANMVKGKAKGSLLTAVFDLRRIEGQDRQKYDYKPLPPTETEELRSENDVEGTSCSAVLANDSAAEMETITAASGRKRKARGKPPAPKRSKPGGRR